MREIIINRISILYILDPIDFIDRIPTGGRALPRVGVQGDKNRMRAIEVDTIGRNPSSIGYEESPKFCAVLTTQNTRRVNIA